MHDEHVERTIEMVQVQVRDLELELAEKKRMVNSLCKLIGREPLFSNVEPSHVGTVLRSDEFYGKALTAVARTVLERRDAAGLGAASVDVLYADLVRGGYQFDAKNDGTAKRSLAISLAKNSYLFHRLPNGDWGLVAWYEKLPTKTNKTNGIKEEKEPSNPTETETDGLAEPYTNDFAVSDSAVGPAQENGVPPNGVVPEQKPARKKAGKRSQTAVQPEREEAVHGP